MCPGPEANGPDPQAEPRDGTQAAAAIHGKGGRHRRCLLWPRSNAVLAEPAPGRSTGDAVFLGWRVDARSANPEAGDYRFPFVRSAVADITMKGSVGRCFFRR